MYGVTVEAMNFARAFDSIESCCIALLLGIPSHMLISQPHIPHNLKPLYKKCPRNGICSVLTRSLTRCVCVWHSHQTYFRVEFVHILTRLHFMRWPQCVEQFSLGGSHSYTQRHASFPKFTQYNKSQQHNTT